MKSGTPRKAPKVFIPSKNKPMYMKESDDGPKRSSPMQPLKKKRLSK